MRASHTRTSILERMALRDGGLIAGGPYILYGSPESVDSHPNGEENRGCQIVKLKSLAL